MFKIIVLMIMCIARMIYLFLPTFLLMIVVQAIIYRITGISIYNKFIKLIMKGVN